LPSNHKQSAPPTRPNPRRLAGLFIAGMLWLNLLLFLGLRDGIKRGYPDFTIFYTAGTILRQGLGHQLYSRSVQYAVQESFTGHIPFRLGPLPYNHPPFEAPIFVPLSLLPYQQAFAAWDLLSVAALFGVAWLLRRSVASLHSLGSWKLVLASFAFFPVFVCLLEGQDSILLVLFCALAFHALKKNADLLAGCWLALAAFKFQFIVPIVLLFVLWKRRRVAVGFAAVAIILALISLGLVGVESLLHYPGYVLQIANNPGLGGVTPELLPNLHGLAMGWHGLFGGAAGAALAILSSVIVFLFAAWMGASACLEKFELQFSLAVLVSVLVAWQTNSHDHSLLVLPMVLIADYCLSARTHVPAIRYPLLLPVLPLLISPLWMALWLLSHKVNLMAIPMLWWTWEIGKELGRGAATASVRVPH
jgi:hypothetical protein